MQFYGQAGCSHCFAFMSGPLKQALADPELGRQLQFEYFPWGNAYYVTSKCQGGGKYDILPRKCYDANCGSEAKTRLPDCFGPGEIVCQNGPVECEADKYVACAKQVSAMDHSKYLPYAECIDGNFEGNPHGNGLDVPALSQGCATSSGLDAQAIHACATGNDATAALQHEAMATPTHGFCPVVVIDGEKLEWGTETQFISFVCAKLPAPKPAACGAAAPTFA